MNRILPIVLAVLACVLIAAATVHTSGLAPATTPQGAVESLLNQVKSHDLRGAYKFVSSTSNTSFEDFSRDVAGSNGSLRTYSALQKYDTKVLNENDQAAQVRANISYTAAVGALYDTRDLKVVKEGGSWKVEWPVEKTPKVPPQVIPVNYLRWDIVTRGSDDDWGAQKEEAPHNQNNTKNTNKKESATNEKSEIVNEDTVPGFVSVGAT